MLKNTAINLGVIRKVACALSDMNKRVAYVGGAVVSLYINDPAADDVRPTKDVDISLQIMSLAHLEEIREELILKGFKQLAEDNVMCRFRYDDIKVDVMSTKQIGWAPSDIWFEPGFKNLEKINWEGEMINIMPLSYFLATKFSAYHDRGTDPRTSHDLEDIIYILDNRTDLIEQIKNAPSDVLTYLKSEFRDMLGNPQIMEAVSANLFYETRQIRLGILKEKLNKIIKNH